ncbi:hypothetical protein E2I00_011179 [Balaenoptera physalus]|uniref:Uncharacterized protein n=1 Tax=Balaenoptera physalus TaxID=9770 RepID=A0A643C5Y8_BALPH|nr:hypothetical protein E2I00_011179 [Balaenoptera physalus]
MKTLQTQRLEVLSAYQYVLTFLFMGPFFSLLLLFLLCTPLWCFSVLYLAGGNSRVGPRPELRAGLSPTWDHERFVTSPLRAPASPGSFTGFGPRQPPSSSSVYRDCAQCL